MKLNIENFGKIKNANIEWNGLTVIAGRNDTGKSTVGKLFYAITKSFAKYETTYSKVVGVEILRDLYHLLSIILRGENRKILQKKEELFVVTESLYEKLSNFFDFGMYSRSFFDLERSLKDNILYTISDLKEIDFSNKKLKEELSSIFLMLTAHVPDEDKFKKSFSCYMRDSFLRNYNNSLNGSDVISIKYFLEDECNLQLQIINNEILTTKIDLSKRFPFYQDITLIDFPEIIDERFQHLNVSNFDWSDDLLEKTKKLRNNFDINNDLKDSFWNKVLDIAFFYVDKETNSFKYKVSNEATSLNIINIASGTKSFGLLYLLVKANIINEGTPIILDEPENHLHPEWQIDYATFIVSLVKNGFRVLLTSHSPLFIHALLKESNKQIKDITKFYLAESGENLINYTQFRDVTKTPNDIFINLTSPEDRMWNE